MKKLIPGDEAMKMVRSLTADDPLADDADDVDAVNESTEENFLFAWKKENRKITPKFKNVRLETVILIIVN